MAEPLHDWAGSPRRLGNVSRLLATLVLHGLVLAALVLTLDRVQLLRRGVDRTTTLVEVRLPPPAMPSRQPALPPPPPRALAATTSASRHAGGASSRSPSQTPAPAPRRPQDDPAAAITLPAPPSPPTVAAAMPPASSPPPDLSFLDSAATRQAIRAVARGDTLSSHGNALTHEAPGSELVAADGSHVGAKRNLPPPPPAVALAQGIEAAHKSDCLKGDYAGGGMGLLSAPFLLANEMLGKCAHKL